MELGFSGDILGEKNPVPLLGQGLAGWAKNGSQALGFLKLIFVGK